MALGVRFLGQNIQIGEYGGFPGGRTILTSNATAFSIIQFFNENGGFEEDSAVYICKNSNGDNTFAVGYQHTDSYGLRTFFKWANSNTGLIPDDDTIPKYPPWNDWYMTGTQDPSYGGFDPDNISLDDIFLNSIAFYQQDEGLYPYYQKSNSTLYTADQCRGGAPVDIIICMGLRNYDGTALTSYTGPTPFMPDFGGFTNWIDTNDVTQPSYMIGTIGAAPEFIYSPLDVAGVWNQDHFDEDTSTSGGGWYSADYGFSGANWGLDAPITLNAIDTGFLTLFSPTSGQLRDLADYMWSSDLVDNMKKLYSDPMESIIMFGILPLNLDDIRDTTTSSVIFGNVDSNVQMYKLKNQYKTLNLGTVTIPEKWGTSLDYEPFTKAQLYLPMVGFVPVKIDDVMGSTINVNYSIDLLSGDFVARVTCTKRTQYVKDLSAPCYLHRGNMLINIPITGMNYSQYYKNLMLQPLSIPQGMIAGNPVGGIQSAVAGATSGLMDGPDVQRSGNYGGSIAALNQRNPCLFLYRPNQQYPENYNEYIGYPSYVTYTLKDIWGYTQCDRVIDNIIPGSDWEKAKIEELLKDGVILPKIERR